MKASMKNVATISKKKKKHLQKKNAALKKKLNSQHKKIKELERLRREDSDLNLSRSASQDQEFTPLEGKVLELKGREAFFISKAAREKKTICNLEKENERLVAKLEARGGETLDDEKINLLTEKLKYFKKLFKKNDEKRRKLNNDVKITKVMFSEMEQQYETLKKENIKHTPKKVKTQHEF